MLISGLMCIIAFGLLFQGNVKGETWVNTISIGGTLQYGMCWQLLPPGYCLQTAMAE